MSNLLHVLESIILKRIPSSFYLSCDYAHNESLVSTSREETFYFTPYYFVYDVHLLNHFHYVLTPPSSYATLYTIQQPYISQKQEVHVSFLNN